MSVSAPYNLHINPALPTGVESGGIAITTPIVVTNDYDGDLRLSPPDIGADEGAFQVKVANDIAVTAVLVPTNGQIVLIGSTFDPQVSYFNSGINNQTNIP